MTASIGGGASDAPKRLVCVFDGPVAVALRDLARQAGWDAAVHDPVSAPDWHVDADTDVVVCDHHRSELGEVLARALAAPARWVGVMGNPRSAGPHVAALRALGVADADVARVHRPVGLDIGSRSPVEIAVSTLAGLLADRNGRGGGPLRPSPTGAPGEVLVGGADPALDAALSEGLTAFNTAVAGASDELTVRVRDDDGALLAGLSGWVWGSSAGIGLLWVRDDARRAGWGARLVAAFEREARARGCARLLVSSFTFQAPGFYERQGFVEVARVPDLPPGHADVHLAKPLR